MEDLILLYEACQAVVSNLEEYDPFTSDKGIAYVKTHGQTTNSLIKLFNRIEGTIEGTVKDTTWWLEATDVSLVKPPKDALDEYLDPVCYNEELFNRRNRLKLENQEHIAQVLSIEAEFKQLREAAQEHRSSLISASSLIEASESRSLSENVKYLTYATIFYLPISLCATLWSVNDMFDTGITGFGIITTVVSVLTYFVVSVLTYFVVFVLTRSWYQTYTRQLVEKLSTKPEPNDVSDDELAKVETSTPSASVFESGTGGLSDTAAVGSSMFSLAGMRERIRRLL
ncbi:Uu.00g082480.m01.CDS01 [Anthostomella pinea]|uniref:Uu.00g082480.m01.CDS01 n=1 Tax=Anthostomella pinea TaxID=933095 RepID=A0AAI8VM26_9PEZI|nr:Uu.00g082480.m01.CDS01 [Anthostomella pinea]